MSVTKRYAITGFVLIAVLVSAVKITRAVQGGNAPVEDPVKTKGPADAPVTLVVYSDFQCPACATARKPIEELKAKFSDVLKVQFRHFPIERIHEWALSAAQFSECAGEQGKFWPYHDKLYDEQATWSKDPNALQFFARYASEIGLDLEALGDCVTNPDIVARIRKERILGASEGVRSTPTMFVDGKALVGGKQLQEQGEAAVREALAKKSGE